MDSNGKLRVAHIITQLELGGAQRNTLYTVGHLNRQQYDPFLLSGPGGILDKETKKGEWVTYFIRWLVRPIRPWKDAAAFWEIYYRLRQDKPHIVHTHSSKAGILGRIAAYFAGVPVIVHTFHGFGFNNRQKPWTRWLFIALEKICAPLSTHLVFVSEENRKEAAELGIGKKVPKSLIRSGIQLTPTSGRSNVEKDNRAENKIQRALKGIPPDSWRVAYVGNFKPQKNPMDLARVAFEVLKQKPNTHFLLAGEGELQMSVENWCRDQGILEHVHFLGWCRRYDDVQKIFDASNCFLMTSLWEGLPRSLVESFAAGKPAVAYGVDGVRDILVDEETGFLIPPGNVQLAAEKILWLAEHPEKAAKMGEKGRERITKDFDIDLMVRQQEELYKSLYDAVPLKTYYEPLWANSSKS
jgi:glycosyltransferase involved in cell wall biosynthesis